jgi:SAM-dependent methyltransferase
VSSSHNFMRWFRGAAPSSAKPAEKAAAAPRTTRRCIGLGEFMKDLRGSEAQKLCALDLGPTSPANITFLTDRHMRVYNEDILRGAKDPGVFTRQSDGAQRLDLGKFFAENLAYPEGHFDAIFCWDAADYLPEELVKPVVEKLHALLKPKGTLLAFFHTKDAGPDSPYCHYHIVQPDTLELEEGPGFRLQRIFNNRHIENLFKDFASRKFFLGRDNIREVIIVR